MIHRNLFLAVALLTLGPGDTFAQSDFFWSFNGLNQGATNSNATGEFSPGSSGSIFLYYSTNGPANSDLSVGAFLDISTSESGIVRFTGAETFDFGISLFGFPLAMRWGDLVGETSSVSDDLIDELAALTLFNGLGILEAHNGSTGLLDAGYDAGADAFLFGRIDFTVLDEPGPDGTSVDILATAGSGGIVNQGSIVNAAFGNATIIVTIEAIVGDINGDGNIDSCDVRPFVQIIVSGGYQEEADINNDGSVNLRDIQPFIALLSSG